jgi:hypothetical protein
VRRDLHVPLVNTPLFDESAFSIFLVCDRAAIEPIYPDRALHFATLEAGAMTQLLEETAEAAGLGICQIGAIDFEPLRGPLHLGEHHVHLHTLLGGTPANRDGESAGERVEELHARKSRQRGRL